jgi:hypothetical protein
METGSLDRHAPLETALKRAGFTVEGVEQQDKKTVITVSRRTGGNKNRKYGLPAEVPPGMEKK